MGTLYFRKYLLEVTHIIDKKCQLRFFSFSLLIRAFLFGEKTFTERNLMKMHYLCSHGVVLGGSEKSSLPPALPPKTKIMFSPSRHLFSPSESVDDSDTTSVNTVEFVPDQVRSVKEKARMIAQQQEEIVRR